MRRYLVKRGGDGLVMLSACFPWNVHEEISQILCKHNSVFQYSDIEVFGSSLGVVGASVKALRCHSLAPGICI